MDMESKPGEIETRKQKLQRKLTLNSWRNKRRASLEVFSDKLKAIQDFSSVDATWLGEDDSYEVINRDECIKRTPLSRYSSPVLNKTEFAAMCALLARALGDRIVLMWFFNHNYAGVLKVYLASILPKLVELIDLDGDTIFVRDVVDSHQDIMFDFNNDFREFGYKIVITGQLFQALVSAHSEFSDWKMV